MSGGSSPPSTSIASSLSAWLAPLREELSRALLAPSRSAVAGSLFFLAYLDHMLDLAAGDPALVEAGLAARRLRTYADVVTRHERLLECLPRLGGPGFPLPGAVTGAGSGMHGPEWEGEGQLFLNVLDFLLAIRHVPQPDTPEATTVLGYYLSAIQSVLWGGPLLRRPISLSQFMRLPVAAGILLAQESRTQTGRPVSSLYPSLPSPGTGQTGFVAFERFRIANAVVFTPELVWLSGDLFSPGEVSTDSPAAPVHLWYNLLKPEQGEFFVSSDVPTEVIGQSPSPDFFRILYDTVCR